VADLPRSVITDQVTNGIAVRMALLFLILGGDAGQRPATIEPVEEAVQLPLGEPELPQVVMPRA